MSQGKEWVGPLTTRERAERQRFLEEQAARGKAMGPPATPRPLQPPVTTTALDLLLQNRANSLENMALSRGTGPIAPLSPPEPSEDLRFRVWYADMARRYGLHPDPDAPEQFYDYRAAWRAGAAPDQSGHWPSQFKLAGHPNMVVGGFNVQTGEREPGTPQATEQELIRLGWDPAFARRVSKPR